MKDIKDYTRVTDVFYPLSGIANVPKHILDEAARKGTLVHEICDAIIEGIGHGEIEPVIQGYVESFSKWYRGNFIAKPQRFFCDDFMITGEIDGIYESPAGLVLVDFKTSSKESKTWKLQGSAYAYLARKAGFNINQIEFLKLDKEGGEPKSFVYEEDFSLFLKCLDVYKYFFKGPVKENILDYL